MTTELITAAEQGDTPTVLRLLQAGANCHGQDERVARRCWRPHGRYTENGQGAPVTRPMLISIIVWTTPFCTPVRRGCWTSSGSPSRRRADPTLTNRFGGVAPIPASEARAPYVETVRELLTRTKINVNHVNNLGWTALLEAIILSDGECSPPADYQTLD
ncbi:MAG: hypothetical protein U0401_08410 [Anaerolineae bacterium]